MRTERLEKLNNARFRLFLRMTALILLVAVYLAMPVYAWFYQGRTAAAVTKISNPTSIYIDAANREDIRYLNLAGIDVQKDPDVHHADYVFSISGHDVNSYLIQLAYTTNNQFTYELYYAEYYADDDPAKPADPFTSVVYTTHPATGDPEDQTYYVLVGATPIAGTILNLDSTEEEHLAYDSNDAVLKYHTATYKTGNNPITTYDNVNKYAEPIYWHSDEEHPIHVRHRDGNNFCDYYVLRVIWSPDAKNDKETDIIYIAAKNVTAGTGA